MSDGTMLEMFERFRSAGQTVEVIKYSFHWQDARGNLIRRWDNAPHHPEVETHPDHVHVGQKVRVRPSEMMEAEKVLSYVQEKLDT